ncbi:MULTISPECIES: flagellar basal body rod protein FlgC [Celeribacter]|jgi:flagellar basal-body rod protein FlgC|uniref:Flagellar basal body rod protein FlgB n=1 Tax=Celeribacter halophilus TaxID=576117 RepID=A0AAW7Y003_9RHOB|nr:flagellar basal body rod protein FlgC [Celeribacter halophilus]MBU2891418.1 flagellar basal body rod protein FlgC [Celeribacter halophilus]MDO6458379.1 flagellar basal body rod protein FlgC [Celeribacter halophilus]MDO6509576.1 flagellar basal body rod protein FlgC [Celeribacter halophilus]MDO6724122.1 flagellar basal body rod protein FlgC [Celeribacter halophilus]
MSDLQNILNLSASGMQAQASRLRHVSENIANADTPGYHRKTVSFEEVTEQGRKTGAVTTGPVELDQSPLKEVYDPGHPLAGEDGFYDSSNVELMIEIADAREAQRSYEANLKVFDQARQMSSSLLDLLRR